jgi:hypothetical protein
MLLSPLLGRFGVYLLLAIALASGGAFAWHKYNSALDAAQQYQTQLQQAAQDIAVAKSNTEAIAHEYKTQQQEYTAARKNWQKQQATAGKRLRKLREQAVQFASTTTTKTHVVDAAINKRLCDIFGRISGTPVCGATDPYSASPTIAAASANVARYCFADSTSAATMMDNLERVATYIESVEGME